MTPSFRARPSVFQTRKLFYPPFRFGARRLSTIYSNSSRSAPSITIYAWTSTQKSVDLPYLVRTEQRISPDGQNLTPVLKTLYEGNFRDAIDSGMSAVFPDDYAELFFRQTEPDRIQLYVRRKHSDREDSVAELSDGTLRFLLLLTILATPIRRRS